jgi:LPS export ABC transporter permease LptG
MLSLIDRYLIREIFPYVLLSLLLLTSIVFLHEASRFSELFVVSSRSGIPMDALWRIVGALVPGILIFTLPISLLIGTLVGLSRLSGDSEIIVLGASGISRWRLLRPVVAVALAVSGLMVYIAFNLLPVSIYKLNHLKANQAVVFQGLNTQIKPRVFEESIPKKILYIEDIDRSTSQWHNIFLVELGEGRNDTKIFTATSGGLREGQRSDLPELYLRGAAWHQVREEKSQKQDPSHDSVEPEAEELESETTATDDAQEKDRKRPARQQNYTSGNFDEMTLGIETSNQGDDDAASKDDKPNVQEMPWNDLINFTPPAEEYLKWRAEIHKRIALPAACLVFALMGVAFGISNVRTGRSFGLLLGLAITIAYYLIAISGESAALSGTLPVWLGIWQANIALAAIGIISIMLQRKPGSDPLSFISSLRHILPSPASEPDAQGNGAPRRNGESDLSVQQGGTPRRRRLLSSMPQLLDRLVLADLSRFFLFILAGFSTLFLIITLFQLLDNITRNNTEWSVVINYLFFLLPLIANNVTPLAALVAVMITFGVLQKTSQVVALKASGQSIYRMAMPVVFASLLLSVAVFFNQDYVLPFTNSRQNNLRYLIRKGQEPPQTFYQSSNQWIFGLDSRIYNYNYFDANTDSFLRLNVIDLSRKPFSISRRLYARRAKWDPQNHEWILENGWERRFEGERLVGYDQFKQRREKLSERPEYFKKDLRGSSSMTLAELRHKIDDLARSGFDVLDLKIALQSKIAFPLTCMVMVLVGLPFSFSVGKRGALYGVSLAIAIGLAYWGSIGLFEQMGRYEMLPPVLAAWGPNLLFGAGGLYLFLTSRT